VPVRAREGDWKDGEKFGVEIIRRSLEEPSVRSSATAASRAR
jgi:hypothetical protein